MKNKNNRFDGIGFEDFKALAKDPSLSKYEKIGFPDSYRQGFEELIFSDIKAKLSNLSLKRKRILDIGPGCSDLPKLLIENCRAQGHHLSLVDSQEMLSELPSEMFIEKVEALFPNCQEFIEKNRGHFDVILCYSVLHYIVVDAGFFRFLDQSLSLLAPGGQFLIGDIPNISKRKRFFSSARGVAHHQDFTKTKELPEVKFNQIEHDQIDDAVVFAILTRARNQGFDAYIIPQPAGLPMANRREDILLIRP